MTSLDAAVSLFSQGINEFQIGKISKAEKLIQQYRQSVEYSSFPNSDNRKKSAPLLSIILVAYQTNDLLIECLKSLEKQLEQRFEIVLVDNGGNESVWDQIKEFSLLHIKCPTNFILSEGRNIGAHFSNSETLVFLDDDAVVPIDYTDRILEKFGRSYLLGFRGKVLPKVDEKHNEGLGHYDLGNTRKPFFINAEGNSGVKKKVYMELEGMNPLLFGHEGTEFSYRLERKFGKNKIYYLPEVTIYHDYAPVETKKKAKSDRHHRMWKYVKRKHWFISRYRKKFQ